jgi:predicted phage baseplate assembly protein
LANVALADHGATVINELLKPPTVPESGTFTPRLRRTELTFAEPWPDLTAQARASISATGSTRPDPRSAAAQVITLFDGERTWKAQPHLLASGRLADFLVEMEPGAVARLRFGDGINGRRPSGGSVPVASYRVGGAQRGNVAAARLTVPLLRPGLPDAAEPFDGAEVEVWNPLPGTGGVPPEPLGQVRQLAPTAFRHQLRAVTSADYAEVAMTNPGVQRAVARRRWTGSWYAQEVTVDPVASRAGDPAVADAVAALLEVRRMAGVDVELARPLYVPLQLEVFGCVTAGYLRADVEGQLLDVLSSRTLPDGRRGLFHPDSFTFGQPLFLSDVVAAAMSVPGLSWVELRSFARMGAAPREAAAALAAGRLDMAAREVLRCDSDPNNPEAGRVDIKLGGGA